MTGFSILTFSSYYIFIYFGASGERADNNFQAFGTYWAEETSLLATEGYLEFSI